MSTIKLISALFYKCTVEDFSEFLLGIHGKISFHHPVVILWFFFQNLCYGLTLVFTEIEYFNSFVFDKTPGKINNIIFTGKLYDAFYCIAYLLITFHLRFRTSQVAVASTSALCAPSSVFWQ